MVAFVGARFSKPIIEFSPSDGVLGITSNGGAGHLMTMEAIGSEFGKQRPNSYYKAVDVIQGSFPPPFSGLLGRLTTSGWNKAKKMGDIQKQEQILKGKIMGISRQRLADVIFFIPVFLATFFRLLFNRKITVIVDTQPIATSAILKAVRLINFLFCRTIRVIKIMTDLPTQEAIHYSASALRMSAADRAIFQLVTTRPFKPYTRETAAEYVDRQESWWKENYGLSLKDNQVRYADFPVRSAFKIWANTPENMRASKLNVKINHRNEFLMIRNLLQGKCQQQVLPIGPERAKEKQAVTIDVGNDAVVGMITLGSQAAKKTINYVENFIKRVKKNGEKQTNYYFFVACGAYIKGKPSLFKDVYQLCKASNLADNVRVIPLGFQDDEEFAPMMHRADFGVYSTGGMTCMEVNSVATGHVLLHSEKNITKEVLNSAPPEEIRKKLLEGFALWEKGNAEYQQHTRGAHIVTPGRLFKRALAENNIIVAQNIPNVPQNLEACSV